MISAFTPTLPPWKKTSEYTPLDFIQMLAYFYAAQKVWPQSGKDNQWDPTTKATEERSVRKLPSRAEFTARFETYDNAIELARAYLSGQDISARPLMTALSESEVCTDDEAAQVLDQAAQLFLRYHQVFGEYPQCGPGTWNQSTLKRLKQHSLTLPRFRYVANKLGGLKAVKTRAEELRRQPPAIFPAVEKPTVVNQQPEPITVEAEVVAAEPPPTRLQQTLARLETPEGMFPSYLRAESETAQRAYTMIKQGESATQQLGETMKVNAELQQVNDQAMGAINDLQERLKKAQQQIEQQKAQIADMKSTINAYAAAQISRQGEPASLPLAVRHLLDPFTRQTLKRFDADPDMKYIGMIFDRAAGALGVMQ